MSSVSSTLMQTYFQAWADTLAELVTQLSGTRWQAGRASLTSEYASLSGLGLRLQGGLHGQQLIWMGRSEATELLRLSMQDESQEIIESDPTHHAALEELGRRWSRLAAAALRPQFGDVEIDVEYSLMNPPPTWISRLITIRGGERSIAVMISVEDGLLPDHDLLKPPAAVAVQATHAFPEGNLGLLLDVELTVILRFGERQAMLREVLELVPGTVLELDREIQEPVDLLLNNRVIARGEVVVIDGNYGLRVSEVASPRQRIDSL